MARIHHYSNVVTTPTMEGWEIVEYLGPIAVHLVAGTGFFSDFAAGLSDIFGGRSESYAGQLSSLYRDALRAVTAQADERGANCVLGFSVDFDEVSGKEKSMFMVTATGTAAHAIRKGGEARRMPSVGRASAELVENAEAKAALLASARAGTLKLTADSWQVIIAQGVVELAPIILASTAEALEYAVDAESQRQNLRLPLAYFNGWPTGMAGPVLYEALADHRLRLAARLLIAQLSLLDYGRVLQLLQAPALLTRVEALHILASHRGLYEPGDLELIDRVLQILPKTLPAAQVVETKAFLGKKQSWTCLVCAAVTEGSLSHCLNCRRDRRGLRSTDQSPEAIAELLSSRRAALKAVLAED